MSWTIFIAVPNISCRAQRSRRPHIPPLLDSLVWQPPLARLFKCPPPPLFHAHMHKPSGQTEVTVLCRALGCAGAVPTINAGPDTLKNQLVRAHTMESHLSIFCFFYIPNVQFKVHVLVPSSSQGRQFTTLVEQLCLTSFFFFPTTA